MADHAFDVYRLLVEEAREARRARRELSNMFLTLNVAGVAGLGLIAMDDGRLNPRLFAWAAVALILVCVVWATSNQYYSRMLGVKYGIIRGYEERLSEHPLRDEYNGMGGAKMMRAFTLERIMPWLFILGYVVFFVVQSGFDFASTWTWVQRTSESLLQR